MWAREAIQTRKPHLTRSLTLPRNVGTIHRRKVICAQAAVNTQAQYAVFHMEKLCVRSEGNKSCFILEHLIVYDTHTQRNIKGFLKLKVSDYVRQT